MRRVAAKFVPKLLNCDQKQHRMNIANEMLDSVRDDPNLLQRVITGDEAWVYGYDVETKAQSSQWKLPHEPRPKKARQVRSNVKVLLTVFFDCRGVVHHEFLPQGRTSPYSPDLAPCDFFLFLKLKRPMKGRRYATLDEIKTASKEELNKILKNYFFEVLRRLEKPLAQVNNFKIRKGNFKGMKINPDMNRSYRNCNNCYNTQITTDHIYPAILAALYMAVINPEEDIYIDKTPQLAGCMDRSVMLHGQDTTTSVGRYWDQCAWADLTCSMDKTLPPQLAGIGIRVHGQICPAPWTRHYNLSWPVLGSWCMGRSDLLHGQETTTSVGRYWDQGAWADLTCSMDKTPPPQLAGGCVSLANSSEPKSLGLVNGKLEVRKNLVVLEYMNGDKCPYNQGQMSLRIVMTCSHTAMPPIRKNLRNKCGYTVTWKHPLACETKLQMMSFESRNYICEYFAKNGLNQNSLRIIGCEVAREECGEAIDKCNNGITSERVLVPYDATLPLCLATDASQIGVGAVLSHIIEGQERPIMFASRTLSEAEQNYSQIEKEALAIIYGVTKFHQFIYGRKFILITDHKPLVTILGSRSGIPTLSTSRLQRWALILSAYTYDIKFRRTQDHGNADLLSRFPVGCEEIPRLNNVYALSYVEELPITAEEIATETEKDEVLSLAKFYTQQGWPEKVADHLRPYFQRKLELTVDGECLVWGMRVVIPPSLRIKMLNCLHETHSGMNKMKAVARSHFWWPNLDTQIEFLVNKCRSCQQSQDGPNKGKWQPWRWSTRPWQRIHIDFANKENINLLIVVDSHSKWIEAIPMRETTTRKTIEQLRRLFSSYGLPEELVSDNGPQFTGSEMKGFLEGNGIKQTLIPAYHPQSNGLAERAVRTIKTALDKNKRKIGDTIQDTLSKVLLAYRSTPHVTTGKTPSELFIGRALRTRVSLIHPSLTSRVRDQQARQMKYDRRTQLEEFQIDDLVWCKNFRGGDKWIPGKIVGKKGTRVYTILIHGQVKAYHRDQIRKRWRNGEEDESGDGERQPEHSRGAGPSAIISEVVRDRGYMESLSPGLTSQRSDQDSEVQSDTDDGKSLEPLRSLDPEALKEEGPVLRRNPPRARRPPNTKGELGIHSHWGQARRRPTFTEVLGGVGQGRRIEGHVLLDSRILLSPTVLVDTIIYWESYVYCTIGLLERRTGLTKSEREGPDDNLAKKFSKMPVGLLVDPTELDHMAAWCMENASFLWLSD
ncbi:K02A2.6-like [Cordylochernes scorpioides]|uniref:RNA-directed DNA polymerase n=1 Tax=Cordylochernes scorpioides TaxID=51811 RepID=A0ABY6JX59_9ARAC|nr:K02A2.6-like [Cordylochernes scorpioides]